MHSSGWCAGGRGLHSVPLVDGVPLVQAYTALLLLGLALAPPALLLLPGPPRCRCLTSRRGTRTCSGPCYGPRRAMTRSPRRVGCATGLALGLWVFWHVRVEIQGMLSSSLASLVCRTRHVYVRSCRRAHVVSSSHQHDAMMRTGTRFLGPSPPPSCQVISLSWELPQAPPGPKRAMNRAPGRLGLGLGLGLNHAVNQAPWPIFSAPYLVPARVMLAPYALPTRGVQLGYRST